MLLIDDPYYRATIASIVDMSRGRAGGVQALTRSRRKDLGTLPWRLEPVEADDRTGQQHEREPTPGDPRGDPTAPQVGPVRRTVVALVSVDRARPGASPPGRRTDRRNVIQDRLERAGVAGVGGGHRGGQRQPAAAAD